MSWPGTTARTKSGDVIRGLGRLAEVTFYVELEPVEIEALKLVLAGLTNEEIAERLGVPIQKVEANFKGLRLAGNLNLVEATRKGLVDWSFPI